VPVREVYLAEFAIAKYEVTNEEYRRHPVVVITWDDMAAYCMWLSDRTGKDYHLPTEAQWEKAARGGLDGKLFPWGDEWDDSMTRMDLTWTAGPVEVGSYPPQRLRAARHGRKRHRSRERLVRRGLLRERTEAGPLGALRMVELLQPGFPHRTESDEGTLQGDPRWLVPNSVELGRNGPRRPVRDAGTVRSPRRARAATCPSVASSRPTFSTWVSGDPSLEALRAGVPEYSVDSFLDEATARSNAEVLKGGGFTLRESAAPGSRQE
jgi:hypothetical protein